MELALEKLSESRDNPLGRIVDVTRRSRGVLGSVYKKLRALWTIGATPWMTPRVKPTAKEASSELRRGRRSYRLAQKTYGRAFLKALPECPVKIL